MQTSRGGIKLVYQDYQYTKHKNNSNGAVRGGAAQGNVQLVWEHSWDRTIATL